MSNERRTHKHRRPAPVRFLVEANNAEGKPECFKVPGTARLSTIVASIPAMKAKGFTNIKITNAA